MEWLQANSCAAALRFGWLVGAASGLYAMAIVIVLVASAPAYRADVPFAVNKSVRASMQWLLFFAQFLLLGAWAAGAYRVGRDFLACFIPTVALAVMAVVAPIMLLLVFTAATSVGRASAR